MLFSTLLGGCKGLMTSGGVVGGGTEQLSPGKLCRDEGTTRGVLVTGGLKIAQVFGSSIRDP